VSDDVFAYGHSSDIPDSLSHSAAAATSAAVAAATAGTDATVRACLLVCQVFDCSSSSWVDCTEALSFKVVLTCDGSTGPGADHIHHPRRRSVNSIE